MIITVVVLLDHSLDPDLEVRKEREVQVQEKGVQVPEQGIILIIIVDQVEVGGKEVVVDLDLDPGVIHLVVIGEIKEIGKEEEVDAGEKEEEEGEEVHLVILV